MKAAAHEQDADRDVSLLAHDQFLREVHWIFPMTDEEEECLLELVAQGRGEQHKACPDGQVLEQARRARERLVEGFQRVVITIASRYGRLFPQLDVDDLIQEGNLGLLQAIEVAEPLPGKHFVGLASRCIACEIYSALHRRNFLYVTGHMRRWFRRLRHARERLQVALVYEPSVAELAREMGVSEEEVRDVVCWQRACQVQSLQGCLAEGREEDELQVRSLYVGASGQDEAGSRELQQVVTRVCEQVLNPRQQIVIGMRFGVGTYDGPFLTYREAEAVLGVTDSSVRQMEMIARKRLARALVTLPSGESELMASYESVLTAKPWISRCAQGQDTHPSLAKAGSGGTG
jgi:RNA polymerase sigma factor (sigma-70 family)